MKMKDKKNENENKQSCENLCNLVVRKRKMIKDERGQWIISAGFLVSVSIIILALLLNQAMMGGYQSSGAILEFPKHEIRELVQETHREVNIAADRAWNMSGEPIVTGDNGKDNDNRTAMRKNFTSIMSNYTNSVEYLYATHGQMVYMNISSVNFSTSPDTANEIVYVNVTILFSDGVTTCTFEPEVIEIPGAPEQVPGPTPSPPFATETLYAVDLTSVCAMDNESNAYGASDNASATVLKVHDGDTVEAVIDNHTATENMVGSAIFQIKLNKTGSWDNDVLEIDYYNGSNWYSAALNVAVPTNLDWIGNYTATEVDTWPEVDDMQVRIKGVKVNPGGPDEGDLEIDAYHVYVVYQVS